MFQGIVEIVLLSYNVQKSNANLPLNLTLYGHAENVKKAYVKLLSVCETKWPEFKLAHNALKFLTEHDVRVYLIS